MDRLPDLLLQTGPYEALMMGNHALARAMLEAGVRVATTYPGSPTPEIAQALDSVPADRRPYYFQYSVNEKVALEVAFGAALNGHLSTVFFKSVGLNVASDSCVQLPLMEIRGGMVVVLGDDPGVNSSQNEQDNRHFCRMAYLPLFEPASPAEAHAMFLEAAGLASRHRTAVAVRLTTHVCHARQVVSFGRLPAPEYAWTPGFDPSDGGPFVPITRSVFPMKRRALARLAEFERHANASPSNRIVPPDSPAPSGGLRRGVITASLPAMSVLENLDLAGAPIDVLKLGLSYPLPRDLVAGFLAARDEVVVIEELDRVMETEIKALAFDRRLATVIRAKNDDRLPGEFGPAETWEILSAVWPDLFPPQTARPADDPSIPARPASMCPGCGHRAAFWAVKKSLPSGAITVGDIGCHTLGAFDPYNIGQVLLCMGHANGTGAGLSINNRSRKVVTFIGDSTFFHAGLPAIVNAVLYDHDLTLVVMENGTTAMTGHQPHAGSGEVGEKIPIRRLLEALGVGLIREVSAYAGPKLEQALKEAIDHPGFSVVIARHPCMLKFTRERQRRGERSPFRMNVDQQACLRVHACVAGFDCPSFVRGEDGKVTVHPDLCIGDGSCAVCCPHGALKLEPVT